MYLFIGLGNPGPTYAHHRHNVGFMAIDRLITDTVPEGQTPQIVHNFDAEYCKLGEFVFAKPQTFMNRSGKAVQKLMQFFKVQPEHVFVFHDDLDIPLGSFKVTQKGPKIHNGIASTTQAIGDNYFKVRIGIENRDPQNRLPGEAFVLQNFSVDEQPVLKTMLAEISRRITSDIMKHLT